MAAKKPINKGSKKGQFRSAPYHFLSGSRRSDTYHPNTDTNFRGYNQQIDTNLLTAVQVAPDQENPETNRYLFQMQTQCGDKGHWQSACPAQYRNFQTDKQNQ